MLQPEAKHTVANCNGGEREQTHETKEKKSGKGGILAAGAGGLAVCAVGGALIGHAMGTLAALPPTSPAVHHLPRCDAT